LPSTVQQAAVNVPVAEMNVHASGNTVIWNGLTVNRTGQNPNDSDIIHANIWLDVNDNGSFDTGNPVPISPLFVNIGAGDSSLQVAISSAYPVAQGVLLIDQELIKYASNDGVNKFTGLT